MLEHLLNNYRWLPLISTFIGILTDDFSDNTWIYMLYISHCKNYRVSTWNLPDFKCQLYENYKAWICTFFSNIISDITSLFRHNYYIVFCLFCSSENYVSHKFKKLDIMLNTWIETEYKPDILTTNNGTNDSGKIYLFIIIIPQIENLWTS